MPPRGEVPLQGVESPGELLGRVGAQPCEEAGASLATGLQYGTGAVRERGERRVLQVLELDRGDRRARKLLQHLGDRGVGAVEPLPPGREIAKRREDVRVLAPETLHREAATR